MTLSRSADHSGRTVRRVTRVHAALTALVFVLASWIGMVHEATTKHVRCAEHGELMDAATAPARSAPSSAERVVRDAPGTTTRGHEHCSLTLTMRDARVDLRPPAIATAPIAIADLAAAAPRDVAAPGDSLYRTAPKTSPPA
jgi:hypothetical protein